MTPPMAANAAILRLKSFYRNSANGECAFGDPPVKQDAGMHPWGMHGRRRCRAAGNVVLRYLLFLSTSSVTRRGRPLSIGNSANALRTRYGISPGIVLPSLRFCAVTW